MTVRESSASERRDCLQAFNSTARLGADTKDSASGAQILSLEAPVTKLRARKRPRPMARLISREISSRSLESDNRESATLNEDAIEDSNIIRRTACIGSPRNKISAGVQHSPSPTLHSEDEYDHEMHGKKCTDESCPSPVRSVISCDAEELTTEIDSTNAPSVDNASGSASLPNPTLSSELLPTHIRSLHLEAGLLPFRPILHRLMCHPIHNRRGTFNIPVDYKALGLYDYPLVIKNPMDFGSIKARLHAVVYPSPDDIVGDIRLVLNNAILYSPPQNQVHIAAKALLEIFEEAYASIAKLANPAFNEMLVDNTNSNESLVQHVVSEVPTVKIPIKDETSRPTGMKRVVSVPHHDDGKSSIMPPPNTVPPKDSELSTAYSTPSSISLSKNVNKNQMPLKHECEQCRGRTCPMCSQSCLHHEPTLLICNGSNCAGTKIRRGAPYYTARDGTRLWCQRCYSNLGAVIPQGLEDSEYGSESVVRYKRDLLKRKNEEEVLEKWVNCSVCNRGVHHICTMFNEMVHNADEFVCPLCRAPGVIEANVDSKFNVLSKHSNTSLSPGDQKNNGSCLFTFISGSEEPSQLSTEIMDTIPGAERPNAESLPQCDVSRFMEKKVRDRMVLENCPPNAEKTVIVRIISDCKKYFSVPDIVRKHFRMETNDQDQRDSSDVRVDSHEDQQSKIRVKPGRSSVLENGVVPPPTAVRYTSKAMALFQKNDGVDVCIFCMYVQEYDGNDDWNDFDDLKSIVRQKKRVYIAYLDSVEHFRPRPCRTQVYHEMLVSYLATARARGFETAHIWACPPTRGNSFVFWNHPNSQRTPTRDRLASWYHEALSRAVDCGVVTDIKSLYEHSFEPYEKSRLEERIMVCPPLLEGDFWIEEAVRAHAASIARHLKSKSGSKKASQIIHCEPSESSRCPASQMAALIQHRIMSHPSSAPFRRPVNAAALFLRDYHTVIKHPMDLGTVLSRCLLGEFDTLRELVYDAELVFSNAMRYNPKGHFVHNLAAEMNKLFFDELSKLVKFWDGCEVEGRASESPDAALWEKYAVLSMHLDVFLGDHCDKSIESSCLTGRGHESSPLSDHPDFDSSSTSPPPVLAYPVGLSTDLSISAEAPQMKEECHPKKCHTSNGISVGMDLPPATLVESEKSMGVEETQTTCISENGTHSSQKEAPNTDILSGGGDAIAHRMVGDDVWLMNKRKKKPSKKRKSSSKSQKDRSDSFSEDSKRRRQSWLGDEVGAAMRRMRRDFFVCDLKPKRSMTDGEKKKQEEYEVYTESFGIQNKRDDGSYAKSVRSTGVSARVADYRHGLLEFSQFRNFEFDTLRRAKYSTTMLLYHLHHADVPGLIPECTSCGEDIVDVRWHKIKKAIDDRRRHTLALKKLKLPSEVWKSEALCDSCHSKAPNGDEFTPLRVSFQRN
mmetsp:Transcript_10345/g.18839  ORF Transcript_10345/g.18839 Transcript_10345/m.18839 type:complete len:1409 (-) Transcript_10345:498-4724(-)|eukprot:CAMPEP_0198303266 /NCGR_PEP_ID=MMETSP1449-20131203/56798_1 /TAXON_ID=420275 /ORGANISM="Attheya septentrionalis, Strain CCMP2084" /LENGTH=1408 /DNA_ID=CAMNT_0044005753 /DNA_START=1547 /DNA_END=5773 /DNA_ORIENTATION=-